MTVAELDVRQVPKPHRHVLIFDRFAALNDGAAFVLVNSHDPKHLREEFERDHAGCYGWDYLESGPTTWRVRITRLAATDVPRVLCHAYALTGDGTPRDSAGAVWKLETRQRHLDANIVRLPPDSRIESHVGPDLDVLLFVVAGDGKLTSSVGSVTLLPGDVTWLPRRSQRSFLAGASGLSYLTVHPRRPGLQIDSPPSGEPADRPRRTPPVESR